MQFIFTKYKRRRLKEFCCDSRFTVAVLCCTLYYLPKHFLESLPLTWILGAFAVRLDCCAHSDYWNILEKSLFAALFPSEAIRIALFCILETYLGPSARFPGICHQNCNQHTLCRATPPRPTQSFAEKLSAILARSHLQSAKFAVHQQLVVHDTKVDSVKY